MAQAAQVSPVVRQARQASPERWQKAAQRALAEGISVRQVNTSGIWVANSGTQDNIAYLLKITGGFVHSCSCPAGTFGDSCCKHAAAYYVAAGLLKLDDPEPDPSALGRPVERPNCQSCGVIYDCSLERAGWLYPPCAACHGTGLATLSAALTETLSRTALAA